MKKQVLLMLAIIIVFFNEGKAQSCSWYFQVPDTFALHWQDYCSEFNCMGFSLDTNNLFWCDTNTRLQFEEQFSWLNDIDWNLNPTCVDYYSFTSFTNINLYHWNKAYIGLVNGYTSDTFSYSDDCSYYIPLGYGLHQIWITTDSTESITIGTSALSNDILTTTGISAGNTLTVNYTKAWNTNKTIYFSGLNNKAHFKIIKIRL